MKKLLRTTGRSRKHLFLTLAILMAGGLQLASQGETYYELHDTKFNRSIAATGALNDVRHEDAGGSLRARWKFVHVVDSFYQIVDITNTKAFFRFPTYNTIEIGDISDDEAFLWNLEDVDGRGVNFRIRNKRYGDYLSAHVEGTTGLFGYMYTYDFNDMTTAKEQIWRLVYRQGSGSVPKDTDGEEIQNETETILSTTNNLSKITIYGLPKTLCGENAGKTDYQGFPNPARPTDQAFMNSFLQTQFGAVNLTQENENKAIDHPISLYVNSTAKLNHTHNYIDLIDPFNNDWHGQKLVDTLKLEKLYTDFYTGEYNLNTYNPLDTFRYGTRTMLARFFFQEQNSSNGDAVNNVYLQIPLHASGVMDHEVPIIGWTTEPQVPYLVLHDPPGDLSFSKFSQSKTICREFENSYTIDEANDLHASVKIGVSGSLGIIVTQDFQFTVEFNGGQTSGDLVVKTSATSNCITTTEDFSTSGLEPEGEGESDVFIGYGYDMNYGKYRVVDFVPDSCKSVINERLIYSLKGSGPDAYRWFVYNEAGIRSAIADQQAILQSGNAIQRDSANAKYQINAWERVLLSNDSIIANATEYITSKDFNGGGLVADLSEAITVLETSTLMTEHYLAGRLGMETVLEIGGSGGSFGYNYTNEKRYGATASQSEEDAEVVAYSLSDDNGGDKYYVDIWRDGRYGTPLFKLAAGSKSSCPYEGGFQRDQPRLEIDGQAEDTILLKDIPVEEDAFFRIDLCNDSDEERTYKVKLNDDSNPDGAIVTLASAPIGGNDFYLTTVPAHSCNENRVVRISKASEVSVYKNLQFYMFPDCDGAISSSIYASVYFGTTAVHDENNLVKQLSVYPNPSSGEINAAFTLDKPTEISFELYNILGNRLLLTEKENYSVGDHNKTFHDDEIPSGVYHLAVKTNTSVISRKVIVQH